MSEGTKVEYTFQAPRRLTMREAELLCRVMQKAAREQVEEWDRLDEQTDSE